MKVAILGSGFAGLSVAWYLLYYTKGTATIDVFDPEPIGGGPSGISSGLLHAFSGKQAKLSWQAELAIEDTHRLLTEASRAINAPLITSRGILRPAVQDEQILNFKAASEKYPNETVWWEKAEAEKKVPGLTLPEKGGGLFIKNGLTINVSEYLKGLWQAVALLGTQFRQQAIIKQADLEKYDRVLVAMGAMTKNFPSLQKLPIEPVKGQILELSWPQHVPPLPFSLVSKKYLVMSADNRSCFAGATFEHDFKTHRAEIEKAAGDILPQVESFFPALKKAKVLSCRAGFRASSPNHLPLLGKVSDKVYFFTALGSKGLLYHGWLGKLMAGTMIIQDTRILPPEVHYKIES